MFNNHRLRESNSTTHTGSGLQHSTGLPFANGLPFATACTIATACPLPIAGLYRRLSRNRRNL